MIIVAWRGLGYWVALIPLAVVEAMFGVTEWPAAKAALPFAVPGPQVSVVLLATTGLVTAAWGFIANRGPGSLVIDPVTGHEFVLRTRHSFYWLPMQVWGLLELAGALALGVSGAG
jgi:hypothetical protein